MKKKQLFLNQKFAVSAIALSCLCSIYSCKSNDVAKPETKTSSNDLVLGTQATTFTPLWSANPNNPWQDSFDNFNIEDNGGNVPTIDNITDPTYGTVWRINKPSGAKRAELSRASGFNPVNGQTIDLNYRWKINPNDNLGNDEITVFQWKTDEGATTSRQNYPFNLTYQNGQLRLNLYGPGTPDWTQGSSINNRKNTIWVKNVGNGQWHTIGFRIKISTYTGTTNSSKGSVELWFDGNKQTFTNENSTSEYDVVFTTDKTKAYHRTNDGVTTYPKWGVYNEASRNHDVTVLFDDMNIKRVNF